MEGEGTQNRPLASIDRVDFGFGCDSVGCWNLQKVAENYKAMSKTAFFSPKSTNFAYNASRVLVSWVLGFGEANPPLNPLASVLGIKYPPPANWSFGSGRNRVDVKHFGRFLRLRSDLDSPIDTWVLAEVKREWNWQCHVQTWPRFGQGVQSLFVTCDWHVNVNPQAHIFFSKNI